MENSKMRTKQTQSLLEELIMKKEVIGEYGIYDLREKDIDTVRKTIQTMKPDESFVVVKNDGQDYVGKYYIQHNIYSDTVAYHKINKVIYATQNGLMYVGETLTVIRESDYANEFQYKRGKTYTKIDGLTEISETEYNTQLNKLVAFITDSSCKE